MRQISVGRVKKSQHSFWVVRTCLNVYFNKMIHLYNIFTQNKLIVRKVKFTIFILQMDF